MIQVKPAIRILLCFLFLVFSLGATAQTSTSSPYSKFGLGELHGDQLPQSRGMGGISTGIRSLGAYYDINVSNPASYSGIRLTTFDIGVFGNYSSMSRGDIKQTNANFSLDHINFAIPVSQKSAFSFGLLPYSSVGYRYSDLGSLDTISINNVYSGEGGISKAYLGYGIQFGKHFSIGFNANYLFGTLKDSKEAQFPQSAGALNTKIENHKAINGLNVDYGVQYSTLINDDLAFVLGYAGNAGGTLRLKESQVAYRTFGSSTGDTENTPLDSISYTEGLRKDLSMPMTHKVGFSFNKRNKWLLGADVHYSNWEVFKEGDYTPPGIQNSYGIALGGQLVPDITSVKYFNLVDYRFGLKYDKTFVNIDGQDVNEMGITIGLGLPLPSNRGASFYKINFAAELMQRGSASNGLIKEQFINFHLGFTLNDRWFRRYQYD